MTLLSKAEILAAADLKTEDVTVEEWGGTVRIKGLSGTGRDAFEESLFTGSGANRKQDLRNIRARLVAATLVDENGARLFSDQEVAELGAKSAAALGRCFDAAQRLNGMSPAVQAELGNDSEPAPSGDSTSA